MFAAVPLAPLAAQQSPNEAGQQDLYGPPPPMEDCSKEQEAAIVSGEIVVCRRKVDQSQYRVSSDEDAERRYAEATMNKGDPRAPDVFGIPDTGVVVARGCFIPPCPPPPALIIDLLAIPEAPPGSDADRVAQGLAPKGDDKGNANGGN